ncbi:alpha-amylase family glycosyl hydrolase, partial [Streptococcus pyogenes]
ADLNNINPKVDQYMKEAIDKWLDLGVDGIRVDAVKHMSQGWQKNWLSHIYEKHNVFVFGEWFSGHTDDDYDMTTFANNSGMGLLDFRFANAIRQL